MKIGYFCIRGSIPWLLNWESKENQLDGAVRSGHTIWAPPVKPKGKAADRNILFWHFWNMQYLIFYCNCSFFDFILKATLGHPRVKNMLNAEFRESVEDFHPWNCINGTKSREASQMIVVVFFTDRANDEKHSNDVHDVTWTSYVSSVWGACSMEIYHNTLKLCNGHTT